MTAGFLTIRAPNGPPDEDGVFRLEVEASNDSFSARATTWCVDAAIAGLVEKLGEFPRGVPDEVMFKTGTPSDITLVFRTLRNTGQCGVLIVIKVPTESSHSLELEDSASFWVMFEPGDLNSFTKRLARLFESGEATLGK